MSICFFERRNLLQSSFETVVLRGRKNELLGVLLLWTHTGIAKEFMDLIKTFCVGRKERLDFLELLVEVS